MSTLPWLSYKRTLKNAYAPRAPIQYAVGNLFSVPSFNIIYGPPGCLKTLFLQNMMICVAAGLSFLDPAPWETKPLDAMKVLQMKALYIDFDNGTLRTDNRFEALAKAYNLADNLPISYYSMPDPTLDASKTGQIMELIDLIKHENAQFVGIDNLAAISGGKDENTSEMMEVVKNLRLVSERTQCVLNAVHHSRKSNGYKGNEGESMRGYSGIRGAIDRGLLIEREPNSDIITIKSEKTRDVKIAPFGAAFTYTHKPGSLDLETARFYGISINGQETDQDIQDVIIEVLIKLKPNGGITQTKLIEEVKKEVSAGENKVRTIINQLAGLGLINVTTGTRGSNIYSAI